MGRHVVPVIPFSPGAESIFRNGIPLTMGILAAQAVSGDLDFKSAARGTLAILTAGVVVDSVARLVGTPAFLGTTPWGRGALVGLGVLKLAVILYGADKLERFLIGLEEQKSGGEILDDMFGNPGMVDVITSLGNSP